MTGSGPVLALRQKGFKDVCKVAGCDLWLNIVDRFHSVKSFYIVGASEDVNACVVEKLRTEYPGIRIAGRRNGFFSDDKEREALISDIAETKPDVVFVAMGVAASGIVHGRNADEASGCDISGTRRQF